MQHIAESLAAGDRGSRWQIESRNDARDFSREGLHNVLGRVPFARRRRNSWSGERQATRVLYEGTSGVTKER